VTNQSGPGREQTVEIASETLISNWSTLRAWVNEDREFLLWRARLGVWVQAWERFDRNEDTLLRGPILTEAQKWFDQRSEDLSEQEWTFINTSGNPRERLDRQRRFRLSDQMRTELLQFANDRSRVAALLAGIVLRDRAFLELVQHPTLKAFNDGLRALGVDDPEALLKLETELGKSEPKFIPNSLWVAWVQNARRAAFNAICEELDRWASAQAAIASTTPDEAPGTPTETN
jgi:hypothetical protein